MFTGIIETMGLVTKVVVNGSNKTFYIESSISAALTIDQSISHNGVCLTIEEVTGGTHRVTAIDETLKKSNLDDWRESEKVNLERSLTLATGLDGHLVQGHVDTVVTCIDCKEKQGSWEFEFTLPRKYTSLVIEKGSIAVNGISLTAFAVKKKSFKVAIIPYTFEHTTMGTTKTGDLANIEFDLIGKYVLRKLTLNQ